MGCWLVGTEMKAHTDRSDSFVDDPAGGYNSLA
jgi:hypothetical protein